MRTDMAHIAPRHNQNLSNQNLSVVGHAQECHAGIGHMCVTQSDTFRCSTQIDAQKTALFGDGDGCWGWWRSGAITAWILQTPNSFS